MINRCCHPKAYKLQKNFKRISLTKMDSAKFFMALERWMQKFYKALFSAQFTAFSTTNERCRNSASQPSGLKNVEAKILHGFNFRFIHFFQDN